MTSNPHLNNIPTLIGGIGQEAVRSFYSNLLPVNKFFPADTEMVSVSQTIDQNQLVDELIFKFTHNIEIGWMLPNIAPTGKRVEIPLVVIVGFKDGKVTHEHIYWRSSGQCAFANRHAGSERTTRLWHGNRSPHGGDTQLRENMNVMTS